MYSLSGETTLAVVPKIHFARILRSVTCDVYVYCMVLYHIYVLSGLHPAQTRHLGANTGYASNNIYVNNKKHTLLP
jgi:hypothetical protein